MAFFRQVVLWGVWATCLASYSPVYAQVDASRDAQARQHFERGRDAYAAGDYEGAREQFVEAHRLSERPEMHYNIGQANEKLGRRDEALQAFRDYVAARPDAANRAEVEARIEALEAESPPQDDSAADVAEREETTQTGARRRHTGLYLRMAGGLGGARDSFSHDQLVGIEGTGTGGSFAGELALGGSLAPGLVLAGALFMEWVIDPKVEVAGLPANLRAGALTMLGVMVDWYVAPEKHGFHLQGALAAGMLGIRGAEGRLSDHQPKGGGLLLGAGYEWAVSQRWGIGVLGRLTAARLAADDLTHHFAAFSVLLSLTMH